MILETTGDKFKEMLTVATICNDVIYMKSENDILNIYSLDGSRSSMILCKFDKGYFTRFEMGDRDMAFDRNAFATVLKRFKKNTAKMEFTEYNVNVVEKNTHWTVPLLSQTNARMPNPAFETGISFKMPVSDFQEEMSRVLDGGSNLRFEMTEDSVKICGGEFDNRDKIYTLLDKNNLKEYTFRPIDEVKVAVSTYSTSFFDWLKIIPTNANLEIRLDQNMPIRIMVSSDNYSYQYVVAPIIESE